jgi:hypothetical protein
MALSLQGFTTLVQNMAAAVQSSCAALLNFNTGSVVRAIQEANASVALWLQWLILQVLSLTRLATSNGADVDTWVADFALTRLPAVAASGSVTFARFQTTIATLIPVGALVKTSDGTRIFTVIADATNAAWNGSTGFTLPAGTASLICTVQDITTGANGALAIGVAGNVQAATINLLASSIAGVDTVTNAAPFVNGIDAESDASLRARFSNYIQTRSRATLAAIGVAIAAVQQGLNWTIQENVNTIGTYTPGSFVVTVDDGTGAPPSSLITAVSLAISTYRPIGSVWAVQAPSVITATITMVITTNPTTNKPALLIPVENAILAYVDALPDGAILPYSRLAMIAYLVDPSIVDVTAVLLNGATADIVPTPGQVVKATAASVTIS